MNARTNKGVYIKLAQHLAQLDYLLPGFVFRVQGFRVGSEVRVETQPGSLLRGPRALPRFVALPLLRTRALFLVRAHARAPGVVRAAGRPCHAPCVTSLCPGPAVQDGGRASATRAAAAPVVRVGAGRPTVGPPGRGPARTLGGRRPPGGAKLFQNHTPILAAAAEDPPPLRGFATG